MYRIYIYICICIDICKEYICMKICMFRYMYKYTCIEYMYRNVYAYRYIGVYRYICVYRYMYNAYTGVFSSQNLRRSFREKRIHRICSYLCVCMWSACCSKALERNIRCRYAPMPVQCAGVEVWSHCPLAKVRASCSGLHSNTSVAENVKGGGGPVRLEGTYSGCETSWMLRFEMVASSPCSLGNLLCAKPKHFFLQHMIKRNSFSTNNMNTRWLCLALISSHCGDEHLLIVALSEGTAKCTGCRNCHPDSATKHSQFITIQPDLEHKN